MIVTPTVAQILVMVGVALDRPLQPAAYLVGMRQGALEMEVMGKVTKGLPQGEREQPIGRIQISPII